AIGNDHIAKPIIVEIGDQRAPTPIRLINPCHKSHIFKDRFAILVGSAIYLKHVPNVLVVVVILAIIDIVVIFIATKHSFFAKIVFGKHFQRNQVYISVVIDIYDIGAHGIPGRMFKIVVQAICESSVFIVNVAEVVGNEVVGNIYIGPTI